MIAYGTALPPDEADVSGCDDAMVLLRVGRDHEATPPASG
jgi:hypothetical protein